MIKRIKFLKEGVYIIEIIIDKNRCNGCGKCKEVCAKGEKIWNISNKLAHVSNLKFCHACMLCQMKCNKEAIKINRPWIDKKYQKPYYDN